MHLSHPLSSVMSSLEAAALEVLARADTDFTGRQVARLAGARNPNGIRKALLRLADVGLVIATPEPHATRYRANREHLLWPAVEAALVARDELEVRIAEFANGASSGSTVALYGSTARGDATAESDVDLLVVNPDTMTEDARDRFCAEIAERIEWWTGNPVQVYDLSDTRFREQLASDDPIVRRWLEEARVVAGPSLAGRLAS